jgi:hypothetical protein
MLMEAARTSETSVYFNETTRLHIPERSNLHTRCRENFKSQTIFPFVAAVQRQFHATMYEHEHR